MGLEIVEIPPLPVVEDAKRRQAAGGRKAVRLPPRRPATPPAKAG
jgi:hypothetical protein